MRATLPLLLGLAGLLACSGSGDKGTAPPAGGGDSGEDTAVPTDCETAGTWETVGLPFSRTYCTGCHATPLEGEARFGAPVGVDLDDLEAVQKLAANHASRVSGGSMPPGAGPSEAERARFVAWLDCGAPGEVLETPEGSHAGLGDAAYEAPVSVSEDGGEPGLLRLVREGSDPDATSPGTTWTELWLVQGRDAWLLELAEAEGGEVVRSLVLDAPLMVGGTGPEEAEQELGVTVRDADGERSETWVFSVDDDLVEAPDPRMKETHPQQLAVVADSGFELWLWLSGERGLVGSYRAWPDGAETMAVVGAGNFIADYGGDFPLEPGAFWVDRVVTWGAP